MSSETALAHDDVVGKAYDARLMRRLLTYLGPYVGAVAVAFAVILVSSLSELAQPWLTQIAIDRYIAAGNLSGLTQVSALFLALLLAGFAADYATTFIVQTIGQRVMRAIRIQVYAHMQTLDVRFYDRHPVGRLMTRVTTDVDAINDLFTSGVITVFGDVLVLAGIMIAMLVMNWRLALVAFLVLPLIALDGAMVPPQRPRVVPAGARPRRAAQRVPAGAPDRHGHRAALRPGAARARPLRTDQPRAPQREHRLDLFLRRVLSRSIEFLAALSGALIIVVGGGWALEGARLARRARGVPAGTRGDSFSPSPTCRRSSTSCRRRWPLRSASSPCSTPSLPS